MIFSSTHPRLNGLGWALFFSKSQLEAVILACACVCMAFIGLAGLIAGMLFLENGAPEDMLPALILVTVGLCVLAFATHSWLDRIKEFAKEACSPEYTCKHCGNTMTKQECRDMSVDESDTPAYLACAACLREITEEMERDAEGDPSC